jgi:hypothetical protein
VTTIEQILLAIVLIFITGTIGNVVGKKGKTSEISCTERRQSCILLVSEKIDGLAKAIESLEEVVNHKILGL